MTEQNDSLKRSDLYAYGSVCLPLALIGYPIAIYLPPFYAQEVGVSMALIGLVLMIARITDVITDPIIGALSDRWRTRFGRRKPWLIAGAVLMVISAFQVFMPSKGAQAGHLLLWTSILYLGWTMVMIPHNAWGAELSEAYHERTRVTAVKESYILLGLVLAGLVPALVQAIGRQVYNTAADGALLQILIFLLGEDGAYGAGLTPILRSIAWIMILLLPVTVLLAVATVKEPPARSVKRIEWKKGLLIVKNNGPFKRMILLLLLLVAAESFRSALSVFFMQYVIAIPMKVGLMYLIFFGAGILGIPFWVWLGKKIGKHLALCAATLMSGFGIACMFWLDAGQIVAFALLFAVKGFCFGSYQLLLMSMLADIVDLDIAEGGEQRTGLFFAMSGMVTKLAMAAGVGGSLALLALTGFNASSITHTSRQIMSLRVLYVMVPLFLYVTVFFIARKYPLTLKHQEKLRDIIARRNLQP